MKILNISGIRNDHNPVSLRNAVQWPLYIVDFIIRHCTDVESSLRELYRRVVFNICIGNSDDHFRNHGFLLTHKGWTLSPALRHKPNIK